MEINIIRISPPHCSLPITLIILTRQAESVNVHLQQILNLFLGENAHILLKRQQNGRFWQIFLLPFCNNCYRFVIFSAPNGGYARRARRYFFAEILDKTFFTVYNIYRAAEAAVRRYVNGRSTFIG